MRISSVMVNADPAWPLRQLTSRSLNEPTLTVLLRTIGNASKSLTSPAQAIPCLIEVVVQLLQ